MFYSDLLFLAQATALNLYYLDTTDATHVQAAQDAFSRKPCRFYISCPYFLAYLLLVRFKIKQNACAALESPRFVCLCFLESSFLLLWKAATCLAGHCSHFESLRWAVFYSISKILHIQCIAVVLCIILACWCLNSGNCVLWAEIFSEKRALKNIYRMSFWRSNPKI